MTLSDPTYRTLLSARDHLCHLAEALNLPEPPRHWQSDDRAMTALRRLLYRLEGDAPLNPSQAPGGTTGPVAAGGDPEPARPARPDAASAETAEPRRIAAPIGDAPAVADAEPTAPGLKATGDAVPLGPLDIPLLPTAPAVTPAVAPAVAPPAAKPILLPNAKMGVPYLQDLPAAWPVDGVIDPDAAAPIAVDPDTGRLIGTPDTAGDFSFMVHGTRDGAAVSVRVKLAVIPDPRSLWIAKESDSNDPHWKPDVATTTVRADLLCIAASKRGRSHAQAGRFRDDDHGIVAAAGGWHVAAVADGAGSASFSRVGSETACRTVTADLPALLAEHVDPLLPDCLAAAHKGDAIAGTRLQDGLYRSMAEAGLRAAKAVEQTAAAIACPPVALSTTLVVAVARPVAGGWFVAGFSIGDGGAVVLQRDGGALAVSPLTEPDSGSFAGETRFLSVAAFADAVDVMNRLRFCFVAVPVAIVAMTDGVSDPKFPTDRAFTDSETWTQFWQDDLTATVDLDQADAAAIGQALLDWLDFWSPGNHDDRTLALMLNPGAR